MDLPVDTLLADRYRIVERRGRGGMAVVYAAHDEVLDRSVAVKVLADHLLDDPRAVQRFEREARAAARLNHPNVVAVHDAAADGDTHFLVMELVEGTTLSRRLQDGPLNITETLAIAGQVAAALVAAHAADMVHRDIKPSNILLTEGRQVKVADFGIARAMTASATQTATAMGSVPYIAPEQLDRHGGADPRSDLYSFGCVLFECLTGHPPFEGDTTAAVLGQHLHRSAPPVASSLPALDDLVADLLAKDPDARPQSATAVRDRITAMGPVPGGPGPDAAGNAVSLAPTERIDHDQYPPTEALADAGTEVVDDRTHTRVLPAGYGADGPDHVSDEIPGPGGPQAPRPSSIGRFVTIAVVLLAVLAIGVWAFTTWDQRPDPATTPTPTAPDATMEPTATEPEPAEPTQTQPVEAPATEPNVPVAPTATPPASTPTTAPTQTGQPAPSAQPTASKPSASPSQQALVDLRQTINDGTDTGQLDAKAADKIGEAVAKVSKHLAGNDEDRNDKAREEIDEVREEIEEQVDDGAAVPGIATQLNRGLDQLADHLSQPG